MNSHLTLLWTDWLLWLLVFCGIVYTLNSLRYPDRREAWSQVMQSPIAVVTLVILMCYLCIALVDSIHIRYSNHHPAMQSILDVMMQPLSHEQEKTYSSPFATHLFVKTTVSEHGRQFRAYAPLKFVNSRGVLASVLGAVMKTLFALLIVYAAIYWLHRHFCRDKKIMMAWRSAAVTFAVVMLLVSVAWALSQHYHILGTDKIGRDIFYLSLKSIRTGVLIGTLTTVFMLPFALFFGALAGYCRGWVDDVIQYVYTTLSSIPGVLLITAAILVMQVYIHNHPQLFPTLASRADARLLSLCLILGITSWTSLCRLIRADTMKLKQLEFVQAARVMGVSHKKIILRHILSNVMHIVLITIVLDFSGLVLAEAVLSYVGVGVDPTTISWGNMINAARLELSRQPVVWWPLVSAMVSMFVLVLSANLFADRIRDAFDPRNR